ncbi:Vesicle-associated protein 2-2 [Pleurostoma richardsiae]|uniref:Vesicle-associated protein 2-2 n=1 Tax=Pleurostoma richardsiae TaxID=41990 RepID=A0AA38VZW5_9PEZI|nr:Vesicle-associated protein 2-2 [Pleurostoma richardsiae]
MSVEIDPTELGFRRPFTVEVAQILKIKNPNKAPVAFKVKTTAPKQYCVRPNSGRIEPDHEVEVTVLLQAMKQDPPLDTKCRDKFLVQSVIISSDKEFNNVQEIWDTVEKASVQEKKIRVSFLPPADDKLGAAATPVRHSLTNGVEATPEVPPPAYSSPGEQATTPLPPSSRETAPEPKDNVREASPSVVSGVTAPVSKPASEQTVDELKEQLAHAETTIATLKQEGGLRQRKGIAAAAKDTPGVGELATAVRPQTTEGVPIQYVAILCLVSFLLAYFFF